MKFEMNEVYRVVFLDHSMGMQDLVVCEVFGRLIGEDDEKIVVCFWNLLGVDEELKENNKECVTIAKSTIKNLSKIRSLKSWKQ